MEEMTMSKTESKLSFAEKTKEFMSLNSHITILDNKSAVIENCKQILECNEVLARILTGSFEIEIWGKDLFLNNYCTECVEVRGVIESINLSARSKREIKK